MPPVIQRLTFHKLGNRIRISVMSIEKDHPNVLDSLMHGNEDIEGKNENFKNMFQDLGVTIVSITTRNKKKKKNNT